MRWRQFLKNLVRAAGEMGRELINAFRELVRSIRSIDRDRIPNPNQVIRELKRILRSILSAGKAKIEELWEAIQHLKDAIGSITKEKMPDMQDVFNSIGEWWLDLRNTVHNIDFNTDWGNAQGKKTQDAFRNKGALSLDKVAEIIAGLRVPGLVLIVLMTVSPWYGAAAMTSSLAVLGPLGMVGGITVLLVLVLIARELTEKGFKQLFQAVLIKLKESGKTHEEILEKINGYPISKGLKAKLREFIEKYSEESDEEMDDIESDEEMDDIENDEEMDDIENDEEMNDIENNEENSNE